MTSKLELGRKPTQKPDLRRRIRLSLWLLLLLAAITGWRVYLVRWPTDGPTWHGLTVGQSTTDDVIAMLGKPSKISHDLMTGTAYHYEGTGVTSTLLRPTIYFRNNQVIRIRVFNRQNATLFDFVEQYGKPDHITDEVFFSTHGESTLKGVHWTDEGIHLRNVFEDGTTLYITYFRPCPRFDGFCIMAEQWSEGGPGSPGEDVWGIMSPLPAPTLTPTPDAAY